MDRKAARGGTATATGTASGNLTVNSSAYWWGATRLGSNGKGGEARANVHRHRLFRQRQRRGFNLVSWIFSGILSFYLAKADAPIANGTSVSEASASIDQPIRNLTEAQGKQAAAFGTALPNRSSIEPLLSQNQTVLAAITDKPILGYGVLGGTTSGNSALYL